MEEHEKTIWNPENTANWNTLKIKQDLCSSVGLIYNPNIPIGLLCKSKSIESSYCRVKSRELIASIYKGGACVKCGCRSFFSQHFHHHLWVEKNR